MLFCLKPCGVLTTALHSLHYKALLASLAALPTIYPLFLKFQLPVFYFPLVSAFFPMPSSTCSLYFVHFYQFSHTSYSATNWV